MIWILDWTPSNNQIPSKKCFEKMYEKRENERTTTNFDFASQIDRSIKHFNTFFVWNHVLWHDIRVWIGESRLKLPIVLTAVCANSCEFHSPFPLFFRKELRIEILYWSWYHRACLLLWLNDYHFNCFEFIALLCRTWISVKGRKQNSWMMQNDNSPSRTHDVI